MSDFSLRTPDVTEKHPRFTEGRTLSSNLVFTIWAVFGGFILHFLLSNYLSVLLLPSYEKPVDTTADLIERNITVFLWPDTDGWITHFKESPDPLFQELSKRCYIAKDWDEYIDDMPVKVKSTGMYADMGGLPPVSHTQDELSKWYRSAEKVPGFLTYGTHFLNKKWPLKEVFYNSFYRICFNCLILEVSSQYSHTHSGLFPNFSYSRITIVDIYHLFTNNQAGLIFHTKYFEQFVWEEQVVVLGLPYFYLGNKFFAFIHLVNFCILLKH